MVNAAAGRFWYRRPTAALRRGDCIRECPSGPYLNPFSTVQLVTSSSVLANAPMIA